MTLLPRTREHMRGGCRILEVDPSTEVHTDLYYLPHVEDGPWGIFDRDDQAVTIAVERRTPELIPNLQVPVSTTAWSDVGETLPSHFEYLYGGRFRYPFGHFLIETLARLWPYLDGFAPHQRVVMHGDGTPAEWFAKPYARDLFGALGLSPDRIVHSDRPFRIERLTLPGPAFIPEAAAHLAMKRLCRDLGRRLVGDLSGAPRSSRPAYLSKTRLDGGVARWLNEPEIEQALARRGVQIVHPQELSFADTIRLLSSREVVCGMTGSAHHVSLFAPPRTRFVLLAAERPNANFFLIDALNGNSAAYYFPSTARNVPDGDPNFIVSRRVEDPVAVAEALLERL